MAHTRPRRAARRLDDRIEHRLQIVGERLMTLEHLGWSRSAARATSVSSRVRACTSSNSARSRSRSPPGRRRSSTSSICLSVKAGPRAAQDHDARSASPSRSSGTAERRSAAGRSPPDGRPAGTRRLPRPRPETWIGLCSSRTYRPATQLALDRVLSRVLEKVLHHRCAASAGSGALAAELDQGVLRPAKPCAVSMIVSRTGCRSFGERLMTSSTSLVAV